MVVAITGANGHIGANLVRSLLDRHQQVRVLVFNDRSSLEGLAVETIKGDIRDPVSLERLLTGADVVYHLAASISLAVNDWKFLESINVAGTRNVVEACLKTGVRRLVHFSSIHAIVQDPLDTPVDETCPLVDISGGLPYDRSKAAAEREIRQGIEGGLDAVILNPTGIIGPYDFKPSHFGAVLLLMARGKLPALVEGGFNWVDVRDVVAAAMRAEEQAPTGAKYILSGHWASIREIAKWVEELAGTPAPRLVVPAWLARTGAPLLTTLNQLTGKRALYTRASIQALSNCNPNIVCDRAISELGYHSRPLRETINDTLLWFRQAGGCLNIRELNNPVKYKKSLFALIIIFFAMGLFLFIGCSHPAVVSESKAVIIDQLYTLQANPAFIEQTTGILTGYGYKVDYYRGDEVTVDFLRRLPDLGYRLIIFRAHAGLLGSGGKAIPRTCIFTDESYSETRHIGEQLSGKLAKARINEESPWVFAIGADFVSSSMQGNFDRTLIITMGCSTLYIPDLAKAFTDKGATAYIGWNASVDLGYVDNATLILLKELGVENASLKGALAATMKAVGPDPYWHAELQYYPVSETLKMDILR